MRMWHIVHCHRTFENSLNDILSPMAKFVMIHGSVPTIQIYIIVVHVLLWCAVEYTLHTTLTADVNWDSCWFYGGSNVWTHNLYIMRLCYTLYFMSSRDQFSLKSIHFHTCLPSFCFSSLWLHKIVNGRNRFGAYTIYTHLIFTRSMTKVERSICLWAMEPNVNNNKWSRTRYDVHELHELWWKFLKVFQKTREGERERVLRPVLNYNLEPCFQ